MGKFKNGFFIGGLLGASLVWLNATKKGREMREELLDHAAVVYAQVKDKLMASDAWKTMSESEYAKTVQDIVDRYVVKTGVSAYTKTMIEKIIRTQWKPLVRKLKEESGRKR